MSDALSSPGPDPAEIRELADRGAWTEVHDRLAGTDRSDLLRDGQLAYLFGQALYYSGRLETLSEFASEFEEVARDSSDARATMRAMLLEGNCAFEMGRTDGARACYAGLMELAEAEGDEKAEADAANNLGAVAALRGRVEESLSYYRLAASLYEKLGEAGGLAQMHHNMALARRNLGRLDDAVESLREAIRLGERVGHRAVVLLSTLERSEIERRRGDLALARRFVRLGLDRARQAGDPISEAEGLRIRALVRHAEDPDHEGALEDLGEALRLAEEAGARYLQAEVQRDHGRILRDRGRDDLAGERLAAALSLFEELGAEEDARRVRATLEEDGSLPG